MAFILCTLSTTFMKCKGLRALCRFPPSVFFVWMVTLMYNVCMCVYIQYIYVHTHKIYRGTQVECFCTMLFILLIRKMEANDYKFIGIVCKDCRLCKDTVLYIHFLYFFHKGWHKLNLCSITLGSSLASQTIFLVTPKAPNIM